MDCVRHTAVRRQGAGGLVSSDADRDAVFVRVYRLPPPVPMPWRRPAAGAAAFPPALADSQSDLSDRRSSLGSMDFAVTASEPARTASPAIAPTAAGHAAVAAAPPAREISRHFFGSAPVLRAAITQWRSAAAHASGSDIDEDQSLPELDLRPADPAMRLTGYGCTAAYGGHGCDRYDADVYQHMPHDVDDDEPVAHVATAARPVVGFPTAVVRRVPRSSSAGSAEDAAAQPLVVDDIDCAPLVPGSGVSPAATVTVATSTGSTVSGVVPFGGLTETSDDDGTPAAPGGCTAPPRFGACDEVGALQRASILQREEALYSHGGIAHGRFAVM